MDRTNIWNVFYIIDFIMFEQPSESKSRSKKSSRLAMHIYADCAVIILRQFPTMSKPQST